MRLTLSADHRIIDVALAAQFLRLLESPWTVLA
jgi:pyruvate/2-oxoglutarate dehydrogenase complex dihydrolipoamide acyltransferase (E2) component